MMKQSCQQADMSVGTKVSDMPSFQPLTSVDNIMRVIAVRTAMAIHM